MAEPNGSLVPERFDQGAGEHNDLQAKLQKLTEFIRDLKQRVESRREEEEEHRQYVRQIIARWEQQDLQSKAAGHDVAFEEYQKRMKEQDARIEEIMRDNRRRIDELERRWGISGDRTEA